MQHSPNDIKEKLLKALDKDNNVVDMGAVMEVITVLEKTQITKEALEKTRLGKYINEIRKKTTNELLAKRAKELVRSWQKLLLPQDSAINGERTIQTNIGISVPGHGLMHHTNKPVSPALINNKKHPRSNSPIAVGSPISWHCSSTSTSPALVVYQGSRPSTPNMIGPKGKLTSPDRGSPVPITHSLPGSFEHHPTTFSSGKSFLLNDVDHTLQRHQNISLSSTENDLLRPSKQKTKTISPTLPSNDKIVKISHSLNVDSVDETNAANKRLRKEESDRAPQKRLCNDNKLSVGTPGLMNGMDFGDSNDSVHSLHDNYRENEKTQVPSELLLSKKSDLKNSKLKKEASDSLKEKLASHARTPKVKTTAQLIEELKARNTNVSVNVVSPTSIQPEQGKTIKQDSSLFSRRSTNNILDNADHDMTKTKSELIEKFLQASVVSDNYDNSSNERYDCHKESSRSSLYDLNSYYDNASSSAPDETEAILNSLPPVKYEDINWEEDNYPEPKIKLVTTDDVIRLHNESWEGMNGNYDYEQNFKKWDEALSRSSYNGELLHILPYVNID